MAEKKYKYRVKFGHRWGPYYEYGPGSTVELTEDEAGGFLDSLELVKDGNVDESVPDEEQIAYLATLTIPQLKKLPEYETFENPRPTKKDDILAAIYKARGLELA